MAERVSKAALPIERGFLVVSIQAGLSDELMIQVQRDLLGSIKEKDVKGVIIDLSDVDILDSVLAKIIFDTGRMAAMMGAQTVYVGIRPGVASSLIDLDVELSDIETAIDRDDAFRRLAAVTLHKEEVVEEEESSVDEDGRTEEILTHETDSEGEGGETRGNAS